MQRNYLYLHFLAMLYVTIMLASLVLANRLIEIHGSVFSMATIIFPIIFSIGDIVTEVYGYKYGRQFLWMGFFCQFFFAILCLITNPLPFPLFWRHQTEYQIVLGPLLKVCTASFVAMLVGGFLNIYLISKWKILLRGQYFWMRSLGSTTIGEAIYTILAISIMFFGEYSIDKIIQMIIFSYAIKVFFNILTIIPVSVSTAQLKKAEGIDIYDTAVNFNPFKSTESK